MTIMSAIPDFELEAKLKEARELGRQEGLITAKGLILRGVADTRYGSGGVTAWEKACDRMHTFINELQTSNFVDLEDATVLHNKDSKGEAFLDVAKLIVRYAPDLAQQLADKFSAEYSKKKQ
jgi:hypothetical protein